MCLSLSIISNSSLTETWDLVLDYHIHGIERKKPCIAIHTLASFHLSFPAIFYLFNVFFLLFFAQTFKKCIWRKIVFFFFSRLWNETLLKGPLKQTQVGLPSEESHYKPRQCPLSSLYKQQWLDSYHTQFSLWSGSAHTGAARCGECITLPWAP